MQEAYVADQEKRNQKQHPSPHLVLYTFYKRRVFEKVGVKKENKAASHNVLQPYGAGDIPIVVCIAEVMPRALMR